MKVVDEYLVSILAGSEDQTRLQRFKSSKDCEDSEDEEK